VAAVRGRVFELPEPGDGRGRPVGWGDGDAAAVAVADADAAAAAVLGAEPQECLVLAGGEFLPVLVDERPAAVPVEPPGVHGRGFAVVAFERFHRVGADSRDAQLRHPLSLRPHRRCLWLCWTVEDAVVERYAVRSQERPMAFTRWEFLRG